MKTLSATKTILVSKITFVILLSCFIASCGGSSGSGNSSNPPVNIQTVVPEEQQTPRAFAVAEPYISGTTYSDVLKRCYQADADTACTFTELTMLGQETDSIQVSDIMERVIVTHDWMGVRFEQMLSNLPVEALPMFKTVAVIFIGSEVDFTTYNTNQARLSITPKVLWISEDEQKAIASVSTGGGSGGDNINTRDDLQFSVFSRFKRNGIILDLNDESEDRSFDRLTDAFAVNLYSSLAFAGNRFPDSVYTLSRPLSTPAIIDSEFGDVIGDPLHADPNLTLQSSFLYDVARVYFNNQPSTAFERALTAERVGAQFDTEGKTELWSSSFIGRDTRTLFVVGMMKYKHDMSFDIGFVEGIGLPFESTIAYGVSNRVAAPLVAPRVKFVMESYLGRSDELDDFFDNGLGEIEYITGTTIGEYVEDGSLATATDTWVQEQMFNYNNNQPRF